MQFDFVRADGQALGFTPGQFLQIHFQSPDGAPAKRSYSLATAHAPEHSPSAEDVIELIVGLTPGGAASTLLQQMPIGETIAASGPFGRFCLSPNDDNARYLLLGTGTGIAPYRAMLPLLEQVYRERQIQVLLLAGTRTPAQSLYDDEFRAFAGRHRWFDFIPCFSRAPPPHPHARSGHVQQALPEWMPDPERDIAYLCGNPNMVDACFAQLRAAGFPAARIRREKYVSNR